MPRSVGYSPSSSSGFKPYSARPKLYMPRTPGGNIVAENRYFDTERTSTTIAVNVASWTGSEYDPNTSAMLCLFAPSQGDDIANRQGRKVFVKKISVHGVLTCPTQTGQSSADLPPLIRVVLYQDMQTNGAQSQGEDVFSTGAGSDAIHMFQNPANFGRFKVWKDKMYTFPPAPISALAGPAIEQSGMVKNFKMIIKPKVIVNYNATGANTVADVVDNSFHILAMSSPAGLAPTITYKTRTVFEA